MSAIDHAASAAAVPIRIGEISTFVLEAPIARPVRNSWRTLTSRSALLIRVTDAEGAEGWGELWCNYPPRGAQHRADLVNLVAAPVIAGCEFAGPEAVFRTLEQALRIPSITSGEYGPFAQVAAGIDNALWDLVAKRAGQPLWQYFGGVSRVAVYASGLSPDEPGPLAAQALRNGFRAVKLKVGADPATDLKNSAELRTLLGASGRLMYDANQRWTVEQAQEAIAGFAEFGPLWMEEPLAGDEPVAAWQALAGRSALPLAAGENVRERAAFDAFVGSGALRFLQPDMGKWGGLTECLPLGRRAIAAGLQFCPHWLGSAVGLMASLNLLGAAGGQGWGEWDANPNPLRELLMPRGITVAEGFVTLSTAPGIGFAPDMNVLKEFAAR
ncbi:MAG: mandelate racemase/muconate lactonizing enzyme family protein [Burkholderiales bacterium]|nr:mandelate racemase/muconate lactonizing enzyme family protein [Burkholderiales bacterium]